MPKKKSPPLSTSVSATTGAATTAPVIHLKGLQISEIGSDDSLCFTCSVWVDGQRAFTASDDGQGGCVNFYPLPGKEALLRQVEAYCKNLPTWGSGSSVDLPMDLESFMSIAVGWKEEMAWLKRHCRKKTLFRVAETPANQWEIVDVPFSPAVRVELLRQCPGAVIANEHLAYFISLPDDDGQATLQVMLKRGTYALEQIGPYLKEIPSLVEKS